MNRIIIAQLVFFLTAGTLLVAQSTEIPSEAELADTAASDAETSVNKAETAVNTGSATTRSEDSEEMESASSTTTTTMAEEDTEEAETVASSTEEESGEGVMYNDGKMNYANSYTKFKLDAADSLSNVNQVEYKIDNTTFQTYKEPFTIKEEGLHSIVYRAVDNAGNYESENVFPVVIDNTPPKLSLVAPENSVENAGVKMVQTQGSLLIRAVDPLSGVKKIAYSLNGAAYEEYSGSEITLDTEGQYVLKYKAMDNLGNETEEMTYVVEADGTAPVVKIVPSSKTVNANGKQYALRNTVFTVEATDKKSGVKTIYVRIDGDEKFQVYSSPINFTEEGEHTIEAQAVDFVGNKSPVVRTDFITDDNPPKSTIQAITSSEETPE